MDKREYRTTSSRIRDFDKVPDPVPPEGDGWILRGGNSEGAGDHIVQYVWYWEREAKSDQRFDETVGEEHLTQ